MEFEKNTREIKEEALNMLRGTWMEGVKLNLIPVIIGIIVYIITEKYSNDSSLAPFLGNNEEYFGSIRIIDIGFFHLDLDISDMVDMIKNLLVYFFTTSITFTFLDWYRKKVIPKDPIKDSFRVFNSKDATPIFLIYLVKKILEFLWSCLFIIPGIIKSLAYSQSHFIYKDLSENGKNNEYSAIDYITESKLLMNGNKGRLFILNLSFIGWDILSIITFGIGYIWVNPYKNAAYAIFYEEISNGRYIENNYKLTR